MDQLLNSDLNELELIQAIAYTTMSELCKWHLESKDAEGLACVPLGYIQVDEKWLKTDVCNDIEKHFPDVTIETGELIFKKILDGSLIGDVLQGFSMGINPARYLVREALSDVEDSPEFLRVREILQKDGLPIVLGFIDEIMNRGVSAQEVISSQIRVQLNIEGYLDENGDTIPEEEYFNAGLPHLNNFEDDFSNSVINNWEYGYVDGSANSTGAKIGRAAGGVGGAVVGAKIGAVIGSVIPVAGTIAGAAIGGVLGNFFGKAVGEELGRDENTDNTKPNTTT